MRLDPADVVIENRDAIDYLDFDKSNGAAWTFVLLARMNGWDVGDPRNNGFGYYKVSVYSRGLYGERKDPEG